MSQLLSSILNLKNKLLEFETQIDTDETIQKEHNLIKERHALTKIPDKIRAIKFNKSNSVILDIRGERLVVSKSAIEECIYETVLSDELKKNPASTTIYLDFDRKILRELLNIMRYFQKSCDSEPGLYRLFLKTKEQKEFFLLELNSFFKSSSLTEKLSLEG